MERTNGIHSTSGGLPYSFSKLKYATQMLSFSSSSLMFIVLRALQRLHKLTSAQTNQMSVSKQYNKVQDEPSTKLINGNEQDNVGYFKVTSNRIPFTYFL